MPSRKLACSGCSTPELVKALVSRIDGVQRRHRPTAFAVAVARKFGEDRATRIAYYAFFSVFPLLLAFVSTVGADTRALERYAESARRDPRERVAVVWETDAPEPHA
jgi:hypothetical protein